MWIMLNGEPFDSSTINEISATYKVTMLDLMFISESKNCDMFRRTYPLWKSFGSEMDNLIYEFKKKEQKDKTCGCRPYDPKRDDVVGYIFKMVYLEKVSVNNKGLVSFVDSRVTRYSKVYPTKDEADLHLTQLLNNLNKVKDTLITINI